MNHVWYTISTCFCRALPIRSCLSQSRKGYSDKSYRCQTTSYLSTETPVTRYTRQDVLRILHLRARQLAAWEREGLIASLADGEHYSFEHLARLRALREMRSKRMTARSIRAQVDAMQKVAGMRNALGETSAVRQGTRLAFRHGGALVEAMTQQLAFDFGYGAGPGPRGARNCRLVVRSTFWRASWGARGSRRRCRRCLCGRCSWKRIRRRWRKRCCCTRRSCCCGRTTRRRASTWARSFYNQREFVQAETMYRRATEADPGYALAFFDLGNVLDERQRMAEAILAYQRAIELVPGYADAHYNLALAFERQGERRRALRHWTAYVRLDPVGPWAAHAKGQARKILGMEKLRIVSRSGRKVAS